MKEMRWKWMVVMVYLFHVTCSSAQQPQRRRDDPRVEDSATGDARNSRQSTNSTFGMNLESDLTK
jgi:hypothetical protein